MIAKVRRRATSAASGEASAASAAGVFVIWSMHAAGCGSSEAEPIKPRPSAVPALRAILRVGAFGFLALFALAVDHFLRRAADEVRVRRAWHRPA